jgi:hypothetical protein
MNVSLEIVCLSLSLSLSLQSQNCHSKLIVFNIKQQIKIRLPFTTTIISHNSSISIFMLLELEGKADEA